MREAEKPSEAFARQLRISRERRRWYQQDLANRLRELGASTDRATIAKIENGTKKRIMLDDAVTLAAALGVNPLHLITPREAESKVRLAPKLERDSVDVRTWFVGGRPLFDEDRRYYEEEVSDDERGKRENPRVQFLLSALHNLIEPLVEGDFKGADEAWNAVRTAAVLAHPEATLSVKSPTVTRSKSRRRK
jgi:transcriptional regulator with XRE-family HTH domain